MRLWVVTEYDYNEGTVIGVYSSADLADKAIAEADFPLVTEAEEYVMDQGRKGWIERKIYLCWLDSEGNVIKQDYRERKSPPEFGMGAECEEQGVTTFKGWSVSGEIYAQQLAEEARQKWLREKVTR